MVLSSRENYLNKDSEDGEYRKHFRAGSGQLESYSPRPYQEGGGTLTTIPFPTPEALQVRFGRTRFSPFPHVEEKTKALTCTVSGNDSVQIMCPSHNSQDYQQEGQRGHRPPPEQLQPPECLLPRLKR